MIDKNKLVYINMTKGGKDSLIEKSKELNLSITEYARLSIIKCIEMDLIEKQEIKDTKACTICEIEKPNNNEYFHNVKRVSKSGGWIDLSPYCKSCHREKNKKHMKDYRAKEKALKNNEKDKNNGREFEGWNDFKRERNNKKRDRGKDMFNKRAEKLNLKIIKTHNNIINFTYEDREYFFTEKTRKVRKKGSTIKYRFSDYNFKKDTGKN